MSLCLDKVEAYALPIYGKSESTTSSPISLPNISANKEKTQVTFYLKVLFSEECTYTYSFLVIPIFLCLLPLRIDTEEWIATIDALVSKSFDACQWLVAYLVEAEGRELIK